MTQVQESELLIPSVLDRLLDFEPGVSQEAPRSRNQVLRELKQSVRRDLEHLLNTRFSYLSWTPDLKELKQSLLNYGLPDFTNAGLGTAGAREDFCRTLQGLLRQYEPRFKSVQVTLLTNSEPLDRTLRFRIDAALRVDPAPEPVVFDSMLEPATGNFAVKGVSR
jgi:type VI secretion system protein ImpF